MVMGEEAIFTTQSRDPLAPLSEAQTLLTVHWYLRNHTLYRAVRTSVDGRKDQPAQAMLEHVESFLLESNSGESQELPLSVTLHLQTQQYGGLILPAIHRSTNSTVERMISQIPVNSE